MDFEEANSQLDSLCGALPRDDLRMHKCIKSDISKAKCMDPLHASPTINLVVVVVDSSANITLAIKQKIILIFRP